jgi:hypothetical protein
MDLLHLDRLLGPNSFAGFCAEMKKIRLIQRHGAPTLEAPPGQVPLARQENAICCPSGDHEG